MTELAVDRRTPSFILLGGFGVVCRNPLYLRELKRRGIDVLLLTPSGWRGEALAAMKDSAHPASLIDEIGFVDGALGTEGSFTAGVIAKAQQWRATRDIVGVYAVGEVLVEQAGIVADALGLRSPGLRATRTCRNKYLQRWYLDEFSPLSVTLPPGERDALSRESVRFPAVVKPSGRHSSSGVETVGGWTELQQVLPSYPEHETLLVEQRVSGQEFSVESLVQDGELVFSSVTRKETTDSHAQTFVELVHSVPSARENEAELLLAANRGLLERLDFRNGIAHSEWRVGDDGKPFLMEVAARTPGDGLLALYELATGAAMEPAIMDIALGEATSYPRPRRYARQVYLEHPVGVLADVVVDWPGVQPSWVGESGIWPDLTPGEQSDEGALRAVLVLKDRGTLLGPLKSSDDRAVSFLIDAPDPQELDLLERRVRAAITIRCTTG
ncbi:acetyl-CoA carboxylase biotin carboxylase subunit family protein [Kitasatospora sp. NPDC058162]|uniref:ATP-grasp domain-containing protein n=1 Tax=Kitasatospora sp. NPDC058162 TaxID=3346362 RepID=UPI0036DB83C8